MLRRLQPRDDRGATLVELIVYGVLLLVVLAVGATLLIGALRAQQRVGNLARATDDQLVGFTEMERVVRNADRLAIRQGGKLLVARTWAGGSAGDRGVASNWRCVGFALRTEPDGTRSIVRWQRAGGTVTGGTADAYNASSASFPSVVASWNVVVEGVSSSATPAFSVVRTAAAPTAAVSLVDTDVAVGDLVRLAVDVTPKSGQQTVNLESTVARRPGTAPGGVTCF